MRTQKTIEVYVGIVRDGDKYLMVQRREPELPEADGRWEWPGGKVDSGEDPCQAVEREIQEETGYQTQVQRVLPATFISDWTYADFDQRTIIQAVEAALVDESQVETHDHHVAEIAWLSIEEIQLLPLLPGVMFFLEHLNEFARQR